MVDEKGNIYYTDDPGKLPEKYRNAKRQGAAEKKSVTPPEKAKIEQRPKPESTIETRRESTLETTGEIASEPGGEIIRPIVRERSIEQQGTMEQQKTIEQRQPSPQQNLLEEGKKEGSKKATDVLSELNKDPTLLQFKTPSLGDGIIGLIGLIILLGGTVWFYVVSFRVSVGWGIACLLVPFAALVFLFKYWGAACKPFGVSIIGTVLLCFVYGKVLYSFL